MSDEGLGSILANAEARMAELKPAPPAAEREGRETLRNIATLLGHDAEAVLKSFDKGGALAALVRSMLNVEARARGRPRELNDSWLTFISVVRLTRSGMSLEDAIAEYAATAGLSEDGARSRYERTRDRDGVNPKSVPESAIAAVYADPRKRP